MPHVLQIDQFSPQWINDFFERVQNLEFEQHPRKLFREKILASAFFTSSLRTKYGFESAMLRLGGKLINLDTYTSRAGPNFSESLIDIIEVFSDMCDVMVLRSSDPRNTSDFAAKAKCILVNGGNGPGRFAEHPTQAISDICFIKSRFLSLLKPNILLVGGMNHRVIRSLLQGFAMMGRKITHVAYPDECSPIEIDISRWKDMGMEVERVESIASDCRFFDVIYHNGVPKDEDGKVPDNFKLSKKDVSFMAKNSLLMHSMPRLDEYPYELDSTPQAAYFQQSTFSNIVKTQLLCDIFLNRIQPKGMQ